MLVLRFARRQRRVKVSNPLERFRILRHFRAWIETFKTKEISKRALTKAPSRISRPLLLVSFVRIGSILIPAKKMTGKKKKTISSCKINTFLTAVRM